MKVRIPKHFSYPPQESTFSSLPRAASISKRTFATSSSSPPTPNPTHWLSTTHARIGHCISFGLTRPQIAQCSRILSILSSEWRSLIAGREGFVAARAGIKKGKVVWGEMDSMGHVNNVMYVRYAETGRVEWACNLGTAEGRGKEGRDRWAELMTPRGERGLILKSIKVEYKFPMKWPDRISVFHKLRHSPSSTTSSSDSSSFILDVLILSEVHQRPAARCEEDIVVYDYKAGKKSSISGFIKEGFEKAWAEQEEEKIRATKRIEEVEDMVRQLETDSWDRPDAVEDMGAAGSKP